MPQNHPDATSPVPTPTAPTTTSLTGGLVSALTRGNPEPAICPDCGRPNDKNYFGRTFCRNAECGLKAEARRQKEALEQDRKARMEKFRESIPEKYRHADEQDDGSLPTLPLDPENILFLGLNGRGKTFAAAVYAIRMAARGFTCVWQDSTMLILRLRASFKDEKRSASELDIIAEFLRPAVLVLDDFGAEKITDYSMQSFYAILAQRMNAEKATVMTTNLSLSELQSAEPRIASRLNGYLMVGMAGPDRRAAKQKGKTS